MGKTAMECMGQIFHIFPDIFPSTPGPAVLPPLARLLCLALIPPPQYDALEWSATQLKAAFEGQCLVETPALSLQVTSVNVKGEAVINNRKNKVGRPSCVIAQNAHGIHRLTCLNISGTSAPPAMRVPPCCHSG